MSRKTAQSKYLFNQNIPNGFIISYLMYICFGFFVTFWYRRLFLLFESITSLAGSIGNSLDISIHTYPLICNFSQQSNLQEAKSQIYYALLQNAGDILFCLKLDCHRMETCILNINCSKQIYTLNCDEYGGTAASTVSAK